MPWPCFAQLRPGLLKHRSLTKAKRKEIIVFLQENVPRETYNMRGKPRIPWIHLVSKLWERGCTCSTSTVKNIWNSHLATVNRKRRLNDVVQLESLGGQAVTHRETVPSGSEKVGVSQSPACSKHRSEGVALPETHGVDLSLLKHEVPEQIRMSLKKPVWESGSRAAGPLALGQRERSFWRSQGSTTTGPAVAFPSENRKPAESGLMPGELPSAMSYHQAMMCAKGPPRPHPEDWCVWPHDATPEDGNYVPTTYEYWERVAMIQRRITPDPECMYEGRHLYPYPGMLPPPIGAPPTGFAQHPPVLPQWYRPSSLHMGSLPPSSSRPSSSPSQSSADSFWLKPASGLSSRYPESKS